MDSDTYAQDVVLVEDPFIENEYQDNEQQEERQEERQEFENGPDNESQSQNQEESPFDLIIDDYGTIEDEEEPPMRPPVVERPLKSILKKRDPLPNFDEKPEETQSSYPVDLDSSDQSEKPRLKGSMFGKLRPVPSNPDIDPPKAVCYNCWESKHNHRDCPDPVKREFCHNCGRRNVSVEECVRCSEAYKTWLVMRQEKQERLEKLEKEGGVDPSTTNKNSEAPSSTTNANATKNANGKRVRQRGKRSVKRIRLDELSQKNHESVRRLEHADRVQAAKLGLRYSGPIDDVRRNLAQVTQRVGNNRNLPSPWARGQNSEVPQLFSQRRRQEEEMRREREFREREEREREFRDRERNETNPWQVPQQRNAQWSSDYTFRELAQRSQGMRSNGPSNFGLMDQRYQRPSNDQTFDRNRFSGNMSSSNQFLGSSNGLQGMPQNMPEQQSGDRLNLPSANTSDLELIRECRMLLESLSNESPTVKGPIVQAITTLLETRVRRCIT